MKKILYGSVSNFLVIALFIFSTTNANAQNTSKKASLPHSSTSNTKFLSGKTIWIVDINTTDSYKSEFQEALLNQMKHLAPGVILKYIRTDSKGNPFFMLKRDNFPDAAIISLGVCEATTKNVANYASEAKKKGIPSIIVYDDAVKNLQQARNSDFNNSSQPCIEIHGMPERSEDANKAAIPAAKELIVKLKQIIK